MAAEEATLPLLPALPLPAVGVDTAVAEAVATVATVKAVAEAGDGREPGHHEAITTLDTVSRSAWNQRRQPARWNHHSWAGPAAFVRR